MERTRKSSDVTQLSNGKCFIHSVGSWVDKEYTYEELVDMLKARYGSKGQTEHIDFNYAQGNKALEKV